MNYKLYVLKVTIPNAEHDKRHKRDLQSIPEFTKGTRFALQPSVPEPQERYRHPAYIYFNKIHTMVNKDLEDLLVAASDEVQPESWNDIVMTIDPGLGDWLTKDVLEFIIQQKLMTAEQLMAIAHTVYNTEE